MKPWKLMLGMFLSGLGAAALATVVWVAPEWLAERALKSQKPAAAQAAVVTTEETPAATPSPEEVEAAQRARFADLLAQNDEVVGWVTVPGTNIDYPVLQTDNNQFYLRHDLDKQYNVRGLPFLDYECDAKNGRHLIIYGHNMGDDETDRFTNLQEYRDPDYYTSHPTIQLDTLYESQVYKIVAVFAVTARTSDPDYFAYNIYINFESDEEEQAYLDEVAQRAFYTTGDYVQPNEKLLSLSTCIYTMPDARIVVMARPLREGESTEADAVNLNSDPLLPARWPQGE